VAGEQTRQRNVEAANAAARGPDAESGVEVAGYDAEPRPKLREVPRCTTEEAQGRRAVVRGARAIVEGQHADERRLAGTVGPEHGGVFTVGNRQREALEDTCRAPDERRVRQLEHRFHSSSIVRRVRGK
jgi:hypothetical protein